MKPRKIFTAEGHVYTQEELRRLQNIGLEMLIEVDRICRQKGIRYELDGGTLLGAVRYKGFIPWDDDVDIRMMQEDFERFREACRTELDQERFFFQDYTTDPGFRWGYGKLLRNGTTFYRTGQDMLKMKRGAFLDIFNCVGMPEAGFAKKWFNFMCLVLRKTAYSPIGAVRETNPVARGAYKVLRLVPFGLVKRGYEKLNHMYRGRKTRLVRTPSWYYKLEDEGCLRRWMDELCELEFEGHSFFAPKDYDGYLRLLYGDDYMTPPPKEKQVPPTTASRLDLGNCGLQEWRKTSGRPIGGGAK